MPCPFCGACDVGFYEHSFAKAFSVICNACGAEGPMRSTHQEAGTLWNRRTGGHEAHEHATRSRL
jgi:Lar family restriction alleviation protein